MILQWYKVVKLHLELFCSSNLVHFQLDQRNSNWSNTIFEQNNSNKLSVLLNWAERIDRDFQSCPCPSLFNRCVKWRSKMFFFTIGHRKKPPKVNPRLLKNTLAQVVVGNIRKQKDQLNKQRETKHKSDRKSH